MGTPAKILITGGTGLLGSTLVPVLRDAGHTVISHGHNNKADYIADLTVPGETRHMLDEVCPHAVINLVALTNVDQCEENPDLARRMNVSTVENLASWIKGNECRFIHISTDHVYDGKGPSKEEDIKIVNTYAASKYEGEKAALQVPATVLRTNIFGNSRHPSRRSFSDWIIDSLKSGTSITVFEDVFFNPLSFEGLSDIISQILTGPKTGIYNLGSRNGMSKAEFAYAVAKAHNLPTSSLQKGLLGAAKLKARRPLDMRMNVEKFEAAFNMALPDLTHEINRTKISDAQAKH